MLLLHISDIHFREIHVEQPDDPNRALRDDLVRDVKIMRERIGKAADGILLSGDIAFAGKAKEYEFALKWLETELCPAAGCKLKDVFVIPGNHDVDRDAANAPVQKNARETLRRLPPSAVEAEIGAYMRDQLSSDVIFGPIENYNCLSRSGSQGFDWVRK
jgi:3',5'-cyclic AMP phosphodiesterase CpdA